MGGNPLAGVQGLSGSPSQESRVSYPPGPNGPPPLIGSPATSTRGLLKGRALRGAGAGKQAEGEGAGPGTESPGSAAAASTVSGLGSPRRARRSSQRAPRQGAWACRCFPPPTSARPTPDPASGSSPSPSPLPTRDSSSVRPGITRREPAPPAPREPKGTRRGAGSGHPRSPPPPEEHVVSASTEQAGHPTPRRLATTLPPRETGARVLRWVPPPGLTRRGASRDPSARVSDLRRPSIPGSGRGAAHGGVLSPRGKGRYRRPASACLGGAPGAPRGGIAPRRGRTRGGTVALPPAAQPGLPDAAGGAPVVDRLGLGAARRGRLPVAPAVPGRDLVAPAGHDARGRSIWEGEGGTGEAASSGRGLAPGVEDAGVWGKIFRSGASRAV